MRPSPPTTTSPVVRTDIQGLRALAVSLVLIYHLTPDSLTGGFVGVDVFFVISGYLITLHLLGHIPTGSRDLVRFWSRRVRRLLPASLLVLAATLIGSRLFAPETQWAHTARDARAAALYFVNWVLAGEVDYQNAENAPSPVQHFWSLSVEEQFYFVWPILILLLGLLARRLGQENRLHVVLAGLVTVVGASLAYSIHITGTDPSAAYFVTPARVWELGVGAILATVTLLVIQHQQADHRHRAPREHLPPAIAVPLAWAGFAAIAWAAVTYDSSTPFPGWQAAVPVLGTAAVIAARSTEGSGSPGNLLALPGVQWLGDVSYAVYLWHWPLIVIVPQATGHDLTWTDRGSILLATLGLAALTKTYVEDRFRGAEWGVPLAKPFAVAGLAMTVVIAGAGVQLRESDQLAVKAQAAANTVLARVVAGNDPCLGAAALSSPTPCPEVGYNALAPRPVQAAEDFSDAYDNQADGADCFSSPPRFRVRVCEFGNLRSPTNIALVGNSHAGQWLPTLQSIAARNNYKVTSLVASQCASAEVRQSFPTQEGTESCARWVSQVVQRVIRMKPEVVVMTNRVSVSAEGQDLSGSYPLYGEGYRKVLEAWRDAGINVLVLHDTPVPGKDNQVPDCIAAAQEDYSRCDGTRSQWIAPEPAEDAVRELGDPNIRFVDLNDHICDGEVCRAVNGGVITYFDGSHLTATYAASLAPFLTGPLLALLPRSARS